LNQLLDFYEIQDGGYAFENDPDAILFKPVTSTIPKWQMLKLLTWIQNLYQTMWDHEMLCASVSSKDEKLFNKTILRKTKECERGGRLKAKFHILFYGENT
jgi:hypothetical protein